MSAHTEARLAVGKVRAGDYIELVHTDSKTPGATSLVIARVTARMSWADEAQANARRLAACWNACDGVSTDELERLSLPVAQHLAQSNHLVAEALSECDQARAELDQAHAEVALMRAALTGTAKKPEAGLESVLVAGRMLVSLANNLGVILTITQVPRMPPAMGNYDTLVEVRQTRAMAKKGGAA